jgi:hypothetical protein
MESKRRRFGYIGSTLLVAGLVATVLALPKDAHTRGWVRAERGDQQAWVCRKHWDPLGRSRPLLSLSDVCVAGDSLVDLLGDRQRNSAHQHQPCFLVQSPSPRPNR